MSLLSFPEFQDTQALNDIKNNNRKCAFLKKKKKWRYSAYYTSQSRSSSSWTDQFLTQKEIGEENKK